MAYILVADDELVIRQILRETIEADGHEVGLASDGNEVMRMVRERLPDLAILDIIMPDKEGLETIMEIRREFPALPVIAMSGGAKVGPQSYLELAQRFGARRALSKPFNISELRQAIKDLLPKSAK
ncbi:MAG: response regulator [Candidatus Sumerlaeota bacterium]|nr:response regulator [Candidatus Sumerlaeota bacterium]